MDTATLPRLLVSWHLQMQAERKSRATIDAGRRGAGWSSREMVDPYARATASERALEEARGLNLRDW